MRAFTFDGYSFEPATRASLTVVDHVCVGQSSFDVLRENLRASGIAAKRVGDRIALQFIDRLADGVAYYASDVAQAEAFADAMLSDVSERWAR